MNNLDAKGHFWLAGKPETQVPGHLTFDSATGARLDLFESFRTSWSVEKGPIRIQGKAGGKILTLDDCQLTDPAMSHIEQKRYRPWTIFDGAHFAEDQPLDFKAVTLQISPLEPWVGRSGVKIDWNRDKDSCTIKPLLITYTPIDPDCVKKENWDLELSFSHGVRDNQFVETTIEQSCRFTLRFLKPQPLEEVLHKCSSLRHLVTAGIDRHVSFVNIVLSHADITWTLPSGEEVAKPIAVHRQWLESETPKGGYVIPRNTMLFTYEDIGGLEGVARWLERPTQYRTVTGLLMSHWYTPNMYLDNKLFNVMAAAEAWERIRLNKQTINFKEVLNTLTAKAGAIFESLVEDVPRWIKKVVQTRNNIVVHPGLQGQDDNTSLYYLFESVYFLIVFCLLRECDVPESTFTKMRIHRKVAWINKNIKGLY